ncbi:MAG: protein kinase [Deltaproteobacteria bacterium]|nr:protein kinase [Deltaproteobacteria bacterium]
MTPKIGRYDVLGQLATGGMAEILLARLQGPEGFQRAVVIKRILRQYAQLTDFVAMFLQEARIIAKIRHPNVVMVHELGEDAGEVFLVLEYVAGENLSSVLKRTATANEKLPPTLVAHLVAEACAGLHAAHELVTDEGKSQNLVHRDVSPQNLFLAYDGHVKLLDFGVARTDEQVARTAVGDVKGKLEYMSPEQAKGEPLDRRSDIFAMGIVLYELSTGRRLFKRVNAARTMEAITKEPIVPPSRLVEGFPRDLEAVVMRALAKRPEDRYASAADMRKDLLDIARVESSPVEALAERMKRLFADRIAEKEEMLRKVREGDAITRVPAGEVEANVEVPAVPEPTRPRRVGIAVAALAGVGIAATAIVIARAAASPSPPPQAAVSGAAASAAPVLAPSGIASANGAPAASPVLVHVETRPPGASVFVDGEERGATPVDLRLPRGTTPVEVELVRVGFSPISQPIVPDADQKLLLSLTPSSSKATGPRFRKPKPAPSATSGFRRFD